MTVREIQGFLAEMHSVDVSPELISSVTDEVMADSEKTPRDIREVEAEGVAYILCSVLDLPGLRESRGYIQNWLAGAEVTDKSAQRIFSAANKILEAGKLA